MGFQLEAPKQLTPLESRSQRQERPSLLGLMSSSLCMGAWGGRAHVHHSGKKEKLKDGLELLKVHPVPALCSWLEQMASHSWNSSVSAALPLPGEALVAPEVTTPGGQEQLLYFTP